MIEVQRVKKLSQSERARRLQMVHEGTWDPRTDVKAGLVALHHKWGEWQDADVSKWFMDIGAQGLYLVFDYLTI